MERYPLVQGQPRWGMEIAERRLDEALHASQMPAEYVRQMPPPLPQVQVWRARVGYPSYQQRQITIFDIIDINRIYKDPRVTFTGSPAGYSGSSRNSMSSVGRGWAE